MDHYNPILGGNVYVRTWYDIAEELQDKVAWVAHKGRVQESFKWLNVLDLIDNEASAYWREYGLDLYSGQVVDRPRNDAIRQTHIPYQTDERISIL